MVPFVYSSGAVPSRSGALCPILTLEEHFTAALLARDEVAFGALLAEDLIHIGFEGQVVGKVEYMAFFKQGAWRYSSYTPSDLVVKLRNDTAIVTGRIQRTIVVNDKETKGAFAFTHVWTRNGEGWRVTSSQVTAIPQ